MKRVLLDTNIHIGWLNAGRHERWVLGPGLLRYLSAVVLMELRVGATTRRAKRAVDALQRAYTRSLRVVSPVPDAFDRAGAILGELRAGGREVRRASLVHDVLIVTTARAIGATVVTADASDFEAIREVERFSLEVVSPDD